MSTTANYTADWLGHALTAIGMIISVGVVLFQLGKQHKSSLKLQRNNAKEELKLKVYEHLGSKVQAFADAEIEAGSYANKIWRELDSQVWSAGVGLKRSTTDLRADKLSSLHYAASGALIDLILAVETWEIAFPAAELFRAAFSSANHDVEEAFGPIYQDAIRLLPTDLGDKGLHVPPLPSAEALENFKMQVDSYTDARTTLRTYTHDLVVESQNLLLSKLFKKRVEIRKPIDPSYKVITASNTEALMHYFRTETASGKSWQETIARVREKVKEKGREPVA